MSPTVRKLVPVSLVLLLPPLLVSLDSDAAETATSPAIMVSPYFPSDIPGGAPQADLSTAAAFAWQEFIALSWPALGGKRDTPDMSKKLGEPGYTGPVVWETFRGKVETFPGESKVQPPGYVSDASQSYGYDAPPQDYIYSHGTISPCSGQASSSTPWVNLDEVTQIGLNQMYAGAGPTLEADFPGPQILFLAKSNRQHYVYSVQPRPKGSNPQKPYSGAMKQIDTSTYGIWNHTSVGEHPWQTDNAAYNALVYNFVSNYAAGKAPVAPYVDFPSGTVEAKSAWRQLTSDEAASGRFHTQTVRYYTTPELYKEYVNPNASTPSGDICYVDDTLGLLALHIIHKTPTAPYFVYATFGQTDNIQTANGTDVEDVNGKVVAAPEQPPLCPGSCPSADAAYGVGTGADPAKGIEVTLASGDGAKQVETFTSTAYEKNPKYPEGGPFATCNPGEQLYYQNIYSSSTQAPLPLGTMCVTQRVHPIPQAVIDANTAAHQAIAQYNQTNGISSSPWSYYKLVNVQWKPVDKPAGQLYDDNDPSVPTASYYQANIVVETDYNLQVFSGQFQGAVAGDDPPPTANLISDYWGADMPMAGKPFHNVYYNGNRHNMGGCMGCHGNAAVNNGSDFSFILQGGRVADAEAAGNPAQTEKADEAFVASIAKYYQMRGQDLSAAPERKRPTGDTGDGDD